MICKACTHDESKVLDTAERGDAIRRRRACTRCGHRWTTWERVELQTPAIDLDAIRAALPALQAIVGRE